jgi:hypothetical protein
MRRLPIPGRQRLLLLLVAQGALPPHRLLGSFLLQSGRGLGHQRQQVWVAAV